MDEFYFVVFEVRVILIVVMGVIVDGGILMVLSCFLFVSNYFWNVIMII